MNDKPIEYFKNEKEFQKCAKEWQHKLFLDDWFIKFELVNKELYLDDTSKETTLFGYCNRVWENHEAVIKISHIKDMKGTVVRGIEELTLVHELLHCLLFPIDVNPNEADYQTLYMDLDNHRKIDQLAKSLLMVKYNIDFDYFYETKE